MTSARLIIDPPAVGTWNMAVDQSLLESADERQQLTLRFYRWSQPTLSLGYFQASAERDSHAASQSCSLIRRSSGGGAILHDHELTYSLCVPSSNVWSRQNTRLYDLVHQQVIELLAEHDVVANQVTGSSHRSPENRSFLCFERHTDGDVLVGGSKILGSAQRRNRNALLQHGSLLLHRSAFAPELAGLADQTDQPFGADDFAQRLAARVGAQLEVTWEPGSATGEETATARRIEAERFASDAWTLRK